MNKSKYKDFGLCSKCKNEKPINKNQLCRDCDLEVDKEFSLLYTRKNME